MTSPLDRIVGSKALGLPIACERVVVELEPDTALKGSQFTKTPFHALPMNGSFELDELTSERCQHAVRDKITPKPNDRSPQTAYNDSRRKSTTRDFACKSVPRRSNPTALQPTTGMNYTGADHRAQRQRNKTGR